ncbi:glucose-1-phosphate adenylyltransferase [Pelosinus sp. UFO1]|uniref:glucose-1-phosphate adenylyltransferase n=1 Tax=Pelosinus sp. UFO1 TaxID=484770 RepID=UPI0004D1BD8A|nr:glucose-1-phosphate adenylyltransferase [Pelosinus sp. UFO1]AIF53926.1 Glucose-1-phosphate adenylyltransferase [Pelosinus sp. UFO1]
MRKKECVAMILAGGQGSRLGSLTQKIAKPAVPFGGKYRIIDFPLSNCHNSGIDTVGVLTQYRPLALHSYIGIGSSWDLDRRDGGVYVLPPYAQEGSAEWYKGTADAIYQNLNFIDMMNPNYVLVLSGDHIYNMDYSLMLEHHKKQKAEATISVIEVPWHEASRFGIMNTNTTGRITEFVEKPKDAKSNLASMGIYIFNWRLLRKSLEEDRKNALSSHDFGKDIIPKLLSDGHRLYAYYFKGYWKDVGTVESFWEANMDLLEDDPQLDLHNPNWRVYSVNATRPPHYVGVTGSLTRSLVGEGCSILGEVDHSVIFPGAHIGKGAVIKDSIIMPYATICENAQVYRGIIGRKSLVERGAVIGAKDQLEITVIEENIVIPSNAQVLDNSMISTQKQVG